MVISEQQAVELAENFIDFVTWSIDGQPKKNINWSPDGETLKEFRKDLRDICIDLMETAKMKEFREMATEAYRLLVRAEEKMKEMPTQQPIQLEDIDADEAPELPPC